MMNIKLLILLSAVSISSAYAHPNHMSFENVQHSETQQKHSHVTAEPLEYSPREEKLKHSDSKPCGQQAQHKTMPCKQK